MTDRFTSIDITDKLIQDSKSCCGCGNKMLGIHSYVARINCESCEDFNCETPEEILTRLNIIR